MKLIEFELRGDYITLDTLLKVTGLAGSGGAGKAMVADGKVEVDGQQELRKTCKVRAGQVVSVAGARVRIHAPTLPAPLDGATERPHEP
jgi:ribosome-associated protein